MTAPWRVGTRGSALALTQTKQTADRLVRHRDGAAYELVTIRTEGDVSTAPLASLGGTGVFAAALRQALLAGEVDLAVHSLKDLPTAPTPGLRLAAHPRREDPRDALCSRDGLRLADLPHGARVGTGSLRRAAQLRALRPDLTVVAIRGNVGTRLARIEQDLDAVVLACAGLRRLGLDDAISETLPPAVMLGAPGQGALAVEVREDLSDQDLLAALGALDDADTRASITAERALLATLEAGCSAPVGAYAEVHDGRLHLDAAVVAVDGTDQYRSQASGNATPEAAAALGKLVAEELLGQGADQLIG